MPAIESLFAAASVPGEQGRILLALAFLLVGAKLFGERVLESAPTR